MNNNKKIGILVISALLSVSSHAFAQDTIDFSLTQDTSFEKIKANKDTLAKAQEDMANKKYNDAIKLLTAYINEKPKKYEVYKLRADAYYAIRRYDLAQKDYQTAIDIKSGEDKFMTNTKYVSAIVLGADKHEQLQNAELGDIYGGLMYALKAQNDPNYQAAFENAVKYNSHIYLPQPNKRDINKINCPQKYGKILNPQGIDAKIYGAIDDIEKGNYNEALYKLQSVTSEYPDYYLGYYLTGVALSELEKDSEAIQAFDKAISLNPYDFESYASLGQIYYSKAETTFSAEDSKKSVQYFNKALKLNKNCPTYYFYIGMNELQAGNTNVAIVNFDKALKINSEDYNSAYYKLIAQYMSGKYQDVVEGTTKLIQKHVSNYNSVKYLRALAYTKLNDTDNALEDLNSIENSIDDIFNNDIKQTSTREKSLESYTHYLKAQIQHSKGAGAAEDNAQAFVNPIIDRLDNAKKAIEPYEKSLTNDTISMEDYKKFENFYSTSLPKLLESGAVVTYDDIDNQYDYIRTTFDDLGISFLYTNPDYKITTIKDYPYKKYGAKLNTVQTFKPAEHYDSDDIENVELAKTENNSLKKSTPSSNLLIQEGQTSLAQMLASDALVGKTTSTKPVEKPVVTTANNDENVTQKFNPEIPDAENTDSSKNIASGENYEMNKPLINSDNTQKVQGILKEEEANNVPAIRGNSEPVNNESTNKGGVKIAAKNIVDNTKQQMPAVDTTKTVSPMKFTADEIKQTDDIVIQYPDVKPVTSIVADSSATAEAGAIAATNTAIAAAEKIDNTVSKAEETSKEAQKTAKEKLKEEKKAAKLAQKAAQEKLNDEINENITQAENTTASVIESAQDIALQEPSTPKTVNIKHANINSNKQNKLQTIEVDNIGDIVELKAKDNNPKVNTESDLFSEKTVFTKPDFNADNLTPKVTLPEEPLTFANDSTNNPVQNNTQSKKTTPKDVPVIKTQEIIVSDINNQNTAVSENTENNNYNGDNETVTEQHLTNTEDIKQKLSNVLDETAPKQTSQPDLSTSKTDELVALQQTINEVEALKFEQQKLKEAEKSLKEQKKAEIQRAKEEIRLQKEQKKAEILKAKNDAKLQKQQAKAELLKAKEQAKLQKQQEKLAAIGEQAKSNAKTSEEKLALKAAKKQAQIDAKAEKQRIKQEKQLAKAQAKAEQQKDEIKINQLKSKLSKEKTKTSQIQQDQSKAKLTFKEKIKNFKSKFSKKGTKTEPKQSNKKVIKQKTSKTEKTVSETKPKEKFSFKKAFSKMKFWKKNK